MNKYPAKSSGFRSGRLLMSLLAGMLVLTSVFGQRNEVTDTQTVIYKRVGAVALPLKIYYPPQMTGSPVKVRPAIVFFFGGGWVNGSMSQFEQHARYFASRGMVAILADYRVQSRNQTTPFDAVMDAKSAMRYIRKNAMLLHVDTGKIAAAGGSAGGHLAAATATLMGLNDPGDDTAFSAKPNALILFNPVIDNGPNGYGYAKVGSRYKEISPIDNIVGQLPPTIIFLGTKDQLIPVATAELYKKRMEDAGNRCELFLYEGQKHGFFNYKAKDPKYYRETVYQADKFLISLGYLNQQPAIDGGRQRIIPLYKTVPNAITASDQEYTDSAGTKVFKVSIPTLDEYLPPGDIATGAAVIICPGGGYGTLVIKREGVDVAKAFTKIGVAAFVLKYRLPSERTMADKSIGPLQDAQQAIKLIRENAGAWHINPAKIGIMGFSAGGHLAAMTGTDFNRPEIDNAGKMSLRPDFMILVYPVISFEEGLVHKGSMNNLLGLSPPAEKIRSFSADLLVSPETPPTLLLHAADDKVVPAENSLRFYNALIRNRVSAELHLFYKGDHGFLKYPSFGDWFNLCVEWMRGNGWLTK